MKKTYKSLIAGLFACIISIFSCTDDFDDVNKNPNKIYNVTPQHVFPGIVYKTMHYSADLNYRFFSWHARYVKHYPMMNDREDMNGAFTNFYVRVLKDLKKLEDMYLGVEGYENETHIILTWKAYVYSILVASFGGVPMSEAVMVTDNNAYRYDTEAEIYAEILRILKEAVDGFDLQGDKFQIDPVFRTEDGTSDIEKWRKFANTLRLDVALRIQNMDASLAEEHIRGSLEHEDWLISSVADIAKGQWGINVNADVSFYYNQFLKTFEDGSNKNQGAYPCLNQYFFLYLRSYQDPRLTVYAKRAPDNSRFKVENDTITRPTAGNPATRDSIIVEYLIPYLPERELRYEPFGWIVGIDPDSPSGTGTYTNPYKSPNIDSWAYVSRDFVKPDASQVFLNWADACFMKAEAAVKYPGIPLSKTAEQYYYEGIDASFAEYGLSGVSTYKAQDGIKWNTNGKGLSEYRNFYVADINGQGGDENHLEQIYKQRYIADFFNGHNGWTLERRTRTLNYPPFFYNGDIFEGSDGICDFMSERLLYPRDEMIYNKDAYYNAIDNLQRESPTPNPARWGDNFYTLLKIAKPNPQNKAQWTSGTIVFNSQFIQKWYGKTEEEFIANAQIEYPLITDSRTLARYIGYKVTKVISTYEP
jgi:hypothetical protein